MRICVPTQGWRGLDEQVSEHFGRAQTFTIVDLETEKVEVIPNTGRHGGGGGKTPAQILVGLGVDALICSGIGPRALNFFEELGIKVYYGAFGTVKSVIERFKTGGLQEASAGRPPCPEGRGRMEC
jgi:predicted Fe-Mo cluster-binding NifX family protein